MDKQVVVYPYNGAQLSNEEEWTSDLATTWMNLKILCQPKKSDTEEYNLYLTPYMKFWRGKSNFW